MGLGAPPVTHFPLRSRYIIVSKKYTKYLFKYNVSPLHKIVDERDFKGLFPKLKNVEDTPMAHMA